ncbi:neprilysin-1-like isoform X2 [Ornithodoros turicata]|uniref:neprilysin-1-like isoform X2 n=1 Tax=Ornithodoros turicata TaxID=34597 RepID=UPI0031398A36
MLQWLLFLLVVPLLCEARPQHENARHNRTVCTSDVCFRRAHTLLSSINPNLDPCEDFYEYVCSGWKKEHPLHGVHMYDVNAEIQDIVYQELKDLLEESSQHLVTDTLTEKLNTAYKSCTKEDVWEEEELHAFGTIMRDAGISRWPIWPPTEDASDWQHLYKASRVGLDMENIYKKQGNPFHLIVSPNGEEPTKYCIFLLAYMPEDSDDEAHQMPAQSTKNNVKRAIQIVNKTITDEDAEAIAEEITAFEVGLSLIHQSKGVPTKYLGQTLHRSKEEAVQRRLHAMYEQGKIEQTSLKGLQRALPQVQWSSFINSMFNEAGVTIDESESIICTNISDFKLLLNYLQAFNRSTVENYFGWKIVESFGEFATSKLRGDNEEARWKKCVIDLTFPAGTILGKVYVDHYFDLQKKEEVDMMLVKVGYPDWLKNETYMNELYSYVGTLHAATPYSIIRSRFLRNNALHDLGKVHTFVNRSETFDIPMVIINAAYMPGQNTIEITPAIVNGVSYESGLPWSVNFAALGRTIGHEISHGFDTTGKHYDGIGRKVNWWTPEADAEYTKRAQCFIDMYDNVTDDETGYKLPGKMWLGENMADNEGLVAAFKAYHAKLKKEGKSEDDALPHLEGASGDMMFFISNAMSYCGNLDRVGFQIHMGDPHCVNKYRVNLPLANMKAFEEAFECKLGSSMIQQHKCHLW